MSFWTDFEASLQKAVTAAKAEIAAAAQYFIPRVEAGAEQVATAALNAALAQAPLLISGAEKLSAATASVVSTIASTGKTVAVNIAETAVQAAVDKLAASGTKPAA